MPGRKLKTHLSLKRDPFLEGTVHNGERSGSLLNSFQSKEGKLEVTQDWILLFKPLFE